MNLYQTIRIFNPKRIRFVSIFFFLLMIAGELHAQTRATVNPDGRFLTVSNFNAQSKINLIDIYETPSRAWIQTLPLPSEQAFDEIRMSRTGKMFYTRTGTHYWFWSTQIANITAQIDEPDQVAFMNRWNYFLVYKNNQLKIHEINTGKESSSYRAPKEALDTLFFTTNDYFLIGQSANEFYFWERKKPRIKKHIRGSQIHVSQKNTRALIVSEKENNLQLISYALPTFRKEAILDVQKILAKTIKEPYTIIPQECSISPNSRMWVISLKVGGVKELHFIDIHQRRAFFSISNKSFSEPIALYPYHFVGDSKVIVKANEITAALFDYKTKKFEKALNCDLGIKNLSPTDQSKKQMLSPDFRFIAYSTYGTKHSTYIKNTSATKEKLKLNNYQFIAWGMGNSKAFVQDDDLNIYEIPASELVSNIKKAKLIAMNQQLWTPHNEKEIETDARPPKGYSYVPIQKFKHISTLSDSSILRLHIKTVELVGDTSGIQVHLMDANGVYYYGADDRAWRHIWRSLKLKAPDGSITNLTNFQVNETRDDKTKPNAIVYVLDHSGSMGNERCEVLQNGVQKFIENKKTIDAVAVVKYDSRIKQSTKLDFYKKHLLENTKPIGMKGFGGSTSLLDAAQMGVALLENENAYNRRTVVLVTDGQENTSRSTKNQVINKALENGVQIVTVGFGENVTPEYLQALSYHTQGSFHHIYDRSDFEWIFQDIENKMRNYYTIKFDTRDIGEYTTVIEVGDDESSDTLVFTFNNRPLDMDAIDDDSPEFELNMNSFSYNELSEKDRNSFEDKPEIPDSVGQEFKRLVFPDIKFVFAKTIIVQGTDKELINVVTFMKKYKYIRIEVQGHTDAVGEYVDNQSLSESRARKVKQELEKHGIAPDRIIFKGYGETRPISKNKTKEGRALNRRVEFHIIKE